MHIMVPECKALYFILQVRGSLPGMGLSKGTDPTFR